MQVNIFRFVAVLLIGLLVSQIGPRETFSQGVEIDRLRISVPDHKGNGIRWDPGGLPDVYACFEFPGHQPQCFGPCCDTTECVIDPETPLAVPDERFTIRVMDADFARHDWIFTAESSGRDLLDPANRVLERRDDIDGRRFSVTVYPQEGIGCQNSETPSCAVYAECFAKYCQCEGNPYEYFIQYGKRYCERFMFNNRFSAAGTRWRNSTLQCLQEAIVPHLDISEYPECDCRRMRTIAFNSHVGCYTQRGASICNLPLRDLLNLATIIDVDDTLTPEGWKQMLEVATICVDEITAQLDSQQLMLWGQIRRSILSKM